MDAKGRFKIKMPNKQFAGKVAGINFYKGIGYTDDEQKAKRLKDGLGYEVKVEGEFEVEKNENVEEANKKVDEDEADVKETAYHCPHCDKAYKSESSLTRHIKEKHEDK